MVKNIKKVLFATANRLAGVKNYEIVPIQKNAYISAADTVQAAQQEGQSVCEYVEALWDQHGWTDRVIAKIGEAGALPHCSRVCEIGPGTGRYLERVLQRVAPKQYDIYEIADDWAAWLAESYSPVVVRQPTDGWMLSHTPDQSCGFVHAHGVFVTLPLLHAFEYFNEMVRVCAPAGHVAFDFYSEEQFDTDTIDHWLASPDRYPVILPGETVLTFFSDHGFNLICEFKNKHGHSYSRYVVLQKTS